MCSQSGGSNYASRCEVTFQHSRSNDRRNHGRLTFCKFAGMWPLILCSSFLCIYCLFYSKLLRYVIFKLTCLLAKNNYCNTSVRLRARYVSQHEFTTVLSNAVCECVCVNCIEIPLRFSSNSWCWSNNMHTEQLTHLIVVLPIVRLGHRSCHESEIIHTHKTHFDFDTTKRWRCSK